VACLDRSDSEHERCTNALKSLTLPFLTTWPVLTEAAWLLRQSPEALQALFTLVEDEYVRIHYLPENSAPWLKDFFARYRDQGPQLADASLIYLADSLDLGTIFTLDRRDFSVYRRGDGSMLEIVPEQS